MQIRSEIRRICQFFVIGFCCIALLGIFPGYAATVPPLPDAHQKIDFPGGLPIPKDHLNPALESSTPEYVIIRASDQVTFSSETGASISTLYVKEGSRFNTGEILLEMDCRLQKAELKKAKAQQMAAKQANMAAKKLKGYGSISDFELIKAESDNEIANAEVDKLVAIVDKCTVKAPFSGSVAEVMVHTHESVKQGDPLLRIVNLENLQFELLVPSCWLKGLQVGSEFSVAINETGDVILARITEINPQIEPVSQSVRLIATITPPNPKLLPGMSGQAKFPEALKKNCEK